MGSSNWSLYWPVCGALERAGSQLDLSDGIASGSLPLLTASHSPCQPLHSPLPFLPSSPVTILLGCSIKEEHIDHVMWVVLCAQTGQKHTQITWSNWVQKKTPRSHGQTKQKSPRSHGQTGHKTSHEDTRNQTPPDHMTTLRRKHHPDHMTTLGEKKTHHRDHDCMIRHSATFSVPNFSHDSLGFTHKKHPETSHLELGHIPWWLVWH